jgi:parallel beta-helix repeat protein
VLVGPGTYFENLSVVGKELVLRSQSGAQVTTLDGGGREKPVINLSGQTRATVVEGFTITAGSPGILVERSEPAIRDNVIMCNVGRLQYRGGAGIACVATESQRPWSPLIEDNVIASNTAQNSHGGGVLVYGDMAPQILGNTISGNEAERVGGGICLIGRGAGAYIDGNRIESNHSGWAGGGICIYGVEFESPGLVISWNVISNNVADEPLDGEVTGGGAFIYASRGWIHHNTIVGNAGRGPGEITGGGIGIYWSEGLLIEQNIIAFSTAGGGILCGERFTSVIRNNLAWHNPGGHGAGSCSDWWATDGNTVADPLFCNPDGGDYSLADGSPALTHPEGPLGAMPDPGCGGTPIHPTTWGQIKARYD